MICPTCGRPLSCVLETRVQPDHTRRRRECPQGHRFTTREEVVVLGGSGTRTPPDVEHGVREAHAGGLSVKHIAGHFDVCESTVRRVLNIVGAGRPRIAVDLERAHKLRAQGLTYTAIAQRLGCSVTLLYRRMQA